MTIINKINCYLNKHHYIFLGHSEPKHIDKIIMHYKCKHCNNTSDDYYNPTHPLVDKQYEWWIHNPINNDS